MTFITETIKTEKPIGTIYFDANCGLCCRATERLRKLVGHHFNFQPGEQLDEIKLRKPNGEILGGVDALLEIARHIWWIYPLTLMAYIPGVRQLMRIFYAKIARHRRQISRVCGLDHKPFFSKDNSVYTETTDNTVRMIAALLLTAAGLILGRHLPPWAGMWLMVCALWTGCKCLTWQRAPLGRTLAYFFAWPGMDPRPFMGMTKPVRRPALREWLHAGLTTLCGLILLEFGARLCMPHSVLLAGWIGMIGCVMALHFGLFHFIALLWQSRGIAVQPIMNHPLRATSVTDFWSRWNRGFRDMAYRVVLLPLSQRIGLTGAILATFLFSGLVHDLIISVPAHGGYGLPTIYFLIQGFAVLLEKSRTGKKLHPNMKRIIAYIVLIAPVGLLFHPMFVLRVFVPFLRAIHAI